MKVKKRIHQGWSEQIELEITPIISKYQYIYSSGKKQISLIKLLNYFHDRKDFWEIYSLEGNLFEDVERFPTKKEAEKRISELLD